MTESEKEQRKQVSELTDPENLVCEMMPFQFSGNRRDESEIREAAHCYVTDLPRFVKLYLDANKE